MAVAGWGQARGRKGAIRAGSRRSRHAVAEQHRAAIFVNQVLSICIFSLAAHPEVGRPGSREEEAEFIRAAFWKALHGLCAQLSHLRKSEGQGEPAPAPAAAPPAHGFSPAPGSEPQARRGSGKGSGEGGKAPGVNAEGLHLGEDGVGGCRRREIGRLTLPRRSPSARREGRQDGRRGRREAGKERGGLRANSCARPSSPFSRVPACTE